MGLMADLDINTEHLRWMGSTRFIYGFLRGAIWQRPCPIQIPLKVSERDKHKTYEACQSALREQDNDGKTCWNDLHLSEELPPLEHSETDTDIPVLYFYGGLIPCVSQDLLRWPLVLPNEGLIDISIQKPTSKLSLVGQMDVVPRGGQYWSKTQHLFKVHTVSRPITPTFSSSMVKIPPLEFSK